MPARALWAWAPVGAWMALLFYVSSGTVPSAAGRIPDWMTHGGAYAVLGVLAHRALDMTLPLAPAGLRLAGAVAIATAYGVSDELHQSFVPGRYADPWDVGKDFGGAALGAFAWRALRGRLGPEPAR